MSHMPIHEKHTASFRFYEELNDFLPKHKRKADISYRFNGKPSIKDAIEAQGVPHTEVELILVNGISVDFNYHLKNGDLVSVYPVFESIDISPVLKLRDAPLRKTAFICDVHLGKLSKLLRFSGFDALYRNDYEDIQIVNTSIEDNRIILTRDRNLLHMKLVTHAYCLRSKVPSEQLLEVINRFDLKRYINPYTRCMSCNGTLISVNKEQILDKLEPKTKIYYNNFFKCVGCDKLYWKGTHTHRLDLLLKNLQEN